MPSVPASLKYSRTILAAAKVFEGGVVEELNLYLCHKAQKPLSPVGIYCSKTMYFTWSSPQSHTLAALLPPCHIWQPLQQYLHHMQNFKRCTCKDKSGSSNNNHAWLLGRWLKSAWIFRDKLVLKPIHDHLQCSGQTASSHDVHTFKTVVSCCLQWPVAWAHCQIHHIQLSLRRASAKFPYNSLAKPHTTFYRSFPCDTGPFTIAFAEDYFRVSILSCQSLLKDTL